MQNNDGVRVLIYDAVRAPGWLDETWGVGAHFARKFGRFDVVIPAGDWPNALAAASLLERPAPITELHFWGHGSWGRLYVGKKAINSALFTNPKHPWHGHAVSLASRMSSDALVWFRTCSTFGNERGAEFAAAAANFFGCRVAASTFNIGLIHSGIHSLTPGCRALWPSCEGVKVVDGKDKPMSSMLWHPNTITFLQSHIPYEW